jgi:geranylgeranyl diphosphate synthase type II
MGYPPDHDKYRTRVDEALPRFLLGGGGPQGLLDAMGYSLLAGGKRIRPVLLLATRDLFPTGGPDPMPAACALELIHTYSLIHDDLPSMDDDDLRRGMPSSHKKFGEATAILAGDGLLTQAFWLLGGAYAAVDGKLVGRLVAEIAMAAGSSGMVGGQFLDTVETGRAVDRGGLERIHRMKTGALIRAAVRCGAILGGAAGEDLDELTAFGEEVGLAFQVADDVLDVTSTAEELGKTTGKDHSQAKNTYVALMGLDSAREYAQVLADRARARLVRFGEPASSLRTLADLIVTRSC